HPGTVHRRQPPQRFPGTTTPGNALHLVAVTRRRIHLRATTVHRSRARCHRPLLARTRSTHSHHTKLKEQTPPQNATTSPRKRSPNHLRRRPPPHHQLVPEPHPLPKQASPTGTSIKTK